MRCSDCTSGRSEAATTCPWCGGGVCAEHATEAERRQGPGGTSIGCRHLASLGPRLLGPIGAAMLGHRLRAA